MNRGEAARPPRARLWSAIGLGAASVAGSCYLIVADAIGRGALWAGHAGISASPLLLVAGAITAVTVAAPGGTRQVALRMVAAVAFAAWGLSQLARSPQLAGILDDVAILLFVIDASVAVIPQARAGLAGARVARLARVARPDGGPGAGIAISDEGAAGGLALEGEGSRR